MRATAHSMLFTAILLVIACHALDKKVGCGNEPLYSKYSIQKNLAKSPDGRGLLAVSVLHDARDPDGYVSYRVKAGRKHFNARLSGWRTEVLWSPDSKAFAVNQTEGGGGIGQRTYILYLTKSGLRQLDVSTPVEKAFGSPVKCEVPTPPNTAVLQWLDSNRILIAAEVVPVSICRCGGTFQTYELSLPDLKIVRIHTQAETKQLFGEALGCELRAADDRCAKSWQPSAKDNAGVSTP